MKNAIPYSLLIIAKRICSDYLDYMREANKIMTILHHRQYPSHVLQSAILRAHEIPREKLFENLTQKEDSKIRYIVTYNPRNPPINSIIEQNADYLIMKKFPLKLEDIQIVYRKANKLRNLLVSGNTSEKPALKHKSSLCENISCVKE